LQKDFYIHFLMFKIFLSCFCLLTNVLAAQNLTKDSLINYSYIINGKDDNKFQTSGTGSIVHYKDQYFLVTNFHVLTAKDANTNKVFKEFKDSNTAASIIFQPLDRKSNFVVNIYPLYEHGKQTFGTFFFKNQIIDISVMPIILPKNAAVFAFELSNIDTTENYLPNEKLIAFGFPKGEFKNSWQPTEFDANAVENYEKGETIYDPFVFFDKTPISGMSGSPVYFYNSENKLKVLSVQSNVVDYNPKSSTIKGRSIYYTLALEIIKQMSAQNTASVKGEEYKNK
jgi:hypothetical protein